MALLRKIKNGSELLARLTKQKIREARGKDIIHVIGDSHSLLFQHPIFQIHYIGPATAHNLGSDKSQTKSKEKITNILEQLSKNRRSFALFVFGEIDARIHIYNTHKQKGISLEEAANATVEKYTKFILDLQKRHPNINLLVFNIIPAGEQGNVYKYPFYASREERQSIAKMLNRKLKESLTNKNISFIETFDQLINNKEERIKEYIFDEIHFNNKIVPHIITDLKKKMIEFDW